MGKKDEFLDNIKNGKSLKTSLIVNKIIFNDSNKVVCILADKTGDIKATLSNKDGNIKEGTVIYVEGVKDSNLEIKKYEILSDYKIEDYLPIVKRPIEDIMNEIDLLTKKYIFSREGKALNDYFFKDETFLEKFKKGIGGVSMHHNYIGGLAEHTLGVMYLTSVLCERYECKRTETAVLGAKLHDIGKIYELDSNGSFKYTLRGEMEGHIVIGVQLIDRAINENPSFYSDDFVNRIKGCIVQHHGKLEYGSPRNMKMEESFIINLADNLDATMNKINQIKSKTLENGWSEYDKKLETRLYL
ncbi:3'-5' exoribonuclease [Clostridium cavendishii DSM 21758]|uniref:3'-5' exoribonuclease n=1 Tax=Clostridium cavendishii DSM 21758 TaxID=1121302 RepID=A0A1M6CG12_9CLOT|nr:3'-5' exoribonuclease YhaM family protein [Clostridium cavendishii]SHI59684.1 3'-5' exoribonuclease [Clostridium cavendishii DSM 21758]